MDLAQVKSLAASWSRSFLAAGITAYMMGATEPKDILKAAIAAVLPVVLRWLNPNDPAFGRVAE